MAIDFNQLSDSELREVLDLPEGKEGLRYHMPKADKIRYLTTDSPDTKEAILAAARSAQIEHHNNLRENRRRGYPDRQALIEEAMGEEVWRFVRSQRTTSGFRDAVTGRKARIAYVVRGVQSERELMLTKSTLLDAHQRLGVINGWPPISGREPAPEAAAAGLDTGAGLRSNLASLRG